MADRRAGQGGDKIDALKSMHTRGSYLAPAARRAGEFSYYPGAKDPHQPEAEARGHKPEAEARESPRFCFGLV
jgi:hypothetical protein